MLGGGAGIRGGGSTSICDLHYPRQIHLFWCVSFLLQGQPWVPVHLWNYGPHGRHEVLTAGQLVTVEIEGN